MTTLLDRIPNKLVIAEENIRKIENTSIKTIQNGKKEG